MILALLDDLMFTSKIRSAAEALAVPIRFARSFEAAMGDIQTDRPNVVILDLNNSRLRPLDAVAAIKADPSLGSVRTVGYASHVHTDVIEAARRAGVDDVLARSVFVQHLPDIIARARPGKEGP